MSTRCSIIYDNDKHIFWECIEDKINLEFYKKDHDNKYNDPQLTFDEIFEIVKYLYGHNMDEHNGFKKKIMDLVNPQLFQTHSFD